MSIPDRRNFIPINGRIMLESVDKDSNIWRVVAVAPNVNLEHMGKPFRVGMLVIPWGYHYHGSTPDAVCFVNPGDIAAYMDQP